MATSQKKNVWVEGGCEVEHCWDESTSESGSDDEGETNHQRHPPSPLESHRDRLARDLDLNSREDFAVVHDNPWTKAKTSAAERTLREQRAASRSTSSSQPRRTGNLKCARLDPDAPEPNPPSNSQTRSNFQPRSNTHTLPSIHTQTSRPPPPPSPPKRGGNLRCSAVDPDKPDPVITAQNVQQTGPVVIPPPPIRGGNLRCANPDPDRSQSPTAAEKSDTDQTQPAGAAPRWKKRHDGWFDGQGQPIPSNVAPKKASKTSGRKRKGQGASNDQDVEPGPSTKRAKKATRVNCKAAGKKGKGGKKDNEPVTFSGIIASKGPEPFYPIVRGLEKQKLLPVKKRQPSPFPMSTPQTSSSSIKPLSQLIDGIFDDSKERQNRRRVEKARNQMAQSPAEGCSGTGKVKDGDWRGPSPIQVYDDPPTITHISENPNNSVLYQSTTSSSEVPYSSPLDKKSRGAGAALNGIHVPTPVRPRLVSGASNLEKMVEDSRYQAYQPSARSKPYQRRSPSKSSDAHQTYSVPREARLSTAVDTVPSHATDGWSTLGTQKSNKWKKTEDVNYHSSKNSPYKTNHSTYDYLDRWHNGRSPPLQDNVAVNSQKKKKKILFTPSSRPADSGPTFVTGGRDNEHYGRGTESSHLEYREDASDMRRAPDTFPNFIRNHHKSNTEDYQRDAQPEYIQDDRQYDPESRVRDWEAEERVPVRDTHNGWGKHAQRNDQDYTNQPTGLFSRLKYTSSKTYDDRPTGAGKAF